MIKRFNKIILSLVILIAINTNVYAVYADTYSTTNFTDDIYGDIGPQINENGQITWTKHDGYYSRVFLFDGTSKIQLTDDDYHQYQPQINDNGQVAWYERISGMDQIFLYDGTEVTQLSSNDLGGRRHRINNSGQVVWEAGGYSYDSEIYLYDGTSVIQLTNNNYYEFFPEINNLGQVVWVGRPYGTISQIFFFDGTNITRLTNNYYWNDQPKINDNGQVVWMGFDGNDSEIYLYDGTYVIQITNNDYTDHEPQINNNGQLVWIGSDGNDKEIYFYDGININQLTNNDYDDEYVRINDNGQVVWVSQYGYASDRKIYLYDGTSVIQLTTSSSHDYRPHINNSGQVVWDGFAGNGFDIFLAAPSQYTPPGDDIVVTPIDPDPIVGDGTEVNISFGTVTSSGDTTVTSSDTGTPLPEGFKLGEPPVYYSIETNADYEPPIQVCINYSNISYGDENNLKLFHQTDTGWQNVTDPGYPDTQNKVICGTVDSFSEFVMLETIYQFVGFLSPLENFPVLNKINAGRSIPLKFQLIDDYANYLNDLNAITDIGLQSVLCGEGSSVNIVYTTDTSGGSGLNYDFGANQFIYNWKTEKNMTGCYRLILELYNFDFHEVYFEMK